MIYVFDTSSFIQVESYYPEIFRSVWKKIDEAVEDGTLISTKEVLKEILRGQLSPHFLQWLRENGSTIFKTPSAEEASFIKEIFAIEHFQGLIGARQRLTGGLVADPFVIACARVRDGTVVTEESWKPNAAKIPNVCDHFRIPCVNLEGFMRDLGWKF
jgi:hypothetical protein